MLLASQIVKLTSVESEAFDATVTSFKINLGAIGRKLNIQTKDIVEFRNGELAMKSETLTKVLLQFKPIERSFYFAMIACQNAAIDGRVKLPLLEFHQIEKGSDIYRQAFKLTISTFRLEQANLSRTSNASGSNLNAWLKGSRDCQLKSLERTKAALTVEQRNFFDAIVNVLFCLAVPIEVEGQLSLLN